MDRCLECMHFPVCRKNEGCEYFAKVEETAKYKCVRILYELKDAVWDIDIPSPTVPEYVEHHEQMQELMHLIDVKVNELIQEEDKHGQSSGVRQTKEAAD